VIIILFGLHTMGVLRIEWLYQEKRLQASRRPAGLLGAMLVGIAFAFGWTPCIGPILSGILFLAGSQDTVGQGVRLLTAYSLGLGVPFFALARIRPHYHKVEVVSGVLLVVIGLLIFTNRFTVIAQWLTPYLPVY
jgi:cytochrome c-type biogenesis protein